MSSSEATPCTHTLRIINFETTNVVSYPIIKLIGLVETTDKNHTCKRIEHYVAIKTASQQEIKANLANGKFKILVELQQGENDLKVTYCGQIAHLSVTYRGNQSDFTVIPLYVICEGHDGYFQAPADEKNDIESACKRINLGSKLLQCFTAEKLYENDMGRKTFSLKDDCKVFRSNLNYMDARKMSQEDLWQRIGREIMQSNIGSDKAKYLAFLSCTLYSKDKFSSAMKTHEEFLQITEGYVALGGGGLALFGTACLYTWPESFDEVTSRFSDGTLVNKAEFLDDSCYRGTRGGCFSTTLGSVLHELYHTFNLGHTETGIMGRGFDNIHKFFTTTDETASKNVSRSFQSQIEFKEEFEAEKLSERLEKENQRKEFSVLRKFEDSDDTFLTKSCAVILGYHKWFNSPRQDQSYMLHYDPSNRSIKSTTGIRAIELRRGYDELVRFSWTFEGKVLKYSFQIPDEALDKTSSILFVEDNVGNTLKEIVDFS